MSTSDTIVSALKLTGAALMLAGVACLVLANLYIGVQLWLGSVDRYFRVPRWVERLHRPVVLRRRHVVLAFAASSSACVVVALPLLIWKDMLGFILPVVLVALLIGINSAIGRLRDLRWQRFGQNSESRSNPKWV